MNKTILIISQKATEASSIYLKLTEFFKDYTYYFLLLGREKEALPFERSFFIQSQYIPSVDIEGLKRFVLEILPEFIFSSSELEVKSLLSQLASSLNVGLLSDITDIKVEGERKIFIKPYVKDIYAELISKTTPTIATLALYERKKLDDNYLSKSQTLNIGWRYHIVRQDYEIKTEKRLEDASKIIGIGRGVKKEDLPLIKELAKRINAAVGYTRPVREEFDFDPSYQIGISGKTISPDLYIALGISGREHHIKAVLAKKIIAVNIDPEAPIKRYADYFICQDYKRFIEIVL